jgi:hypothetical protein
VLFNVIDVPVLFNVIDVPVLFNVIDVPVLFNVIETCHPEPSKTLFVGHFRLSTKYTFTLLTSTSSKLAYDPTTLV